MEKEPKTQSPRIKVLDDWLEKHGARCRWKKEINKDILIEAYMLDVHIFIVVRFHGSDGWDIYTSSNDITVSGTLSDAETRLGIQEETKPGKKQ